MSEKLLRKNFYEKVLAFSRKREYLIEVRNDGVLPVMGRTPSFVPWGRGGSRVILAETPL